MDGLLTAEELAAEFDENLDDVALYAEYRRLAAEQAALRRLATLVARGVEPSEVFGAVADEMRRCLNVFTAGLWCYESSSAITMVGAAAEPTALANGSILATAALSAPEVMVKTVGAALDGFGDLPDEEREMLFETFRVWQDNDASVGGTAEVLFCHPNTVRHRLRRIEKRTGRSLSRPRDVAELCLAFEVHRRLM